MRPDLVVKRGYCGRHRFEMTVGGEQISGNVWVDPDAMPPTDTHDAALARIKRLAETLRAAVETHPARGRPAARVDVSAARLQTFHEGGRHGEV